MAAPKVKVTYQGGRELIATVSPRAQVMTEEKYDGMSMQVIRRASFYSAWAALKCANLESVDFEPWLNLIDDVEDVKTRFAPCSVCGKSNGCSFDDDGEPLWHEPPTVVEDKSADPTQPAPSPDAS
jgi:hypothetical protein